MKDIDYMLTVVLRAVYMYMSVHSVYSTYIVHVHACTYMMCTYICTYLEFMKRGLSQKYHFFIYFEISFLSFEKQTEFKIYFITSVLISLKMP